MVRHLNPKKHFGFRLDLYGFVGLGLEWASSTQPQNRGYFWPLMSAYDRKLRFHFQ
jgi:hypothetical protein